MLNDDIITIYLTTEKENCHKEMYDVTILVTCAIRHIGTVRSFEGAICR